MLYHRLSVVLLSKVIIWKFPTSWRQIILWKATWNFLGQKFLTTELSLKDIELGLKSPMESFPFINLQSVAGWEYIYLFEKRPHNFKYGTGLSAVYAIWHWSIWYQIVSVSRLSSKKNITVCFAVTARSVLQPKYWIFHHLLRYSC